MMEPYNSLTTVMLLESDAIVRTEIGELLRECGYRVIEGASAEDMRAVLESGTRVDIVLAEVNLDGATTGFELAQELRQTWPKVDVKLASGVNNLVEKATSLCGEGPVMKAYRPEQIRRRIQVLLGRRRLNWAAGE